MDNMFNSGGFYWWTGVVEDRNDPLFLGRCRVRIVGFHTRNKEELPTADLPWAQPMQPITSAATSGVGTTPLGPVEGTWVVGFFADSDDGQQPIMMGTLAGIQQKEYLQSLGNDGFQDPAKNYPRREKLDEPDTNRLARGEKLDGTIVKKKKESRTKKVEIAFGESTWDQPSIPYAAQYPFNHVTESESGHTIEIDDTNNAERLHVYHKMGTFVEIDSTGTMVRKIVGDDFAILESNGYIYIKGKANITVDGSSNIYVKNNVNLEVDGKLKIHAHGDIEMKAGKKFSLSAVDALDVHCDGPISVNGKKTLKVKTLMDSNIWSAIKTTISSPILECAILKPNMMSITPVPPKIPSISPPSTTKAKSPTETVIVANSVVTPEEKVHLEVQKQRADEQAPHDKTKTAGEYAAVKEAEITTGEKVSAPVPITTEIIPDPHCASGAKIVEIALKDVGVVESRDPKTGGGKNCGGKPGGGELPLGSKPYGAGNPGRIDEMLKACGLDNQAHIAAGGNIATPKGTQQKIKTGEGFYWCASAVSAWWKEAGLKIPPATKDDGPASCKSWARWAKKNQLYSLTPEIGAAILYGPDGGEHHIGIVAEITGDRLLTIEGNTSSGPNFDRNGGGCFKKCVPNWQARTKDPAAKNFIAFVTIPKDGCNEIPQVAPPVEYTTAKPDLKTYLDNVRGKFGLPEDTWQQLPGVAEKFEINTPLRMAHFLAQIKAESNFKGKEERLHAYTTVDSIKRGFKGNKKMESKTLDELKAYCKNGEALGNLVYSDRMKNGPIESGEGYKYRGRGCIQLTGKENYMALRKVLPDDVVANPDLVVSKYAIYSAGWFWKDRGINAKADKGTSSDVVLAVSKAVNGGTNGLAERQKYFTDFASLI